MAGVDDALEDVGSVLLVCAPPLLLIVTPGATSSVVDVAPVVFVLVGVSVVLVSPVAPAPVLDDVEPALDGVASEPVDVEVEEVAVPPLDSVDAVLAEPAPVELADEESDEEPVVSA